MKSILKFIVLAVVSSSLMAVSCDSDTPDLVPENGTVNVKIELYNDASPMDWDETIAIGNVNEYRMEFFKYYLCNIYAVRTDGEKIMLKDVLLADASTQEGQSFTFDLKNGTYDKLQIGVGLDTLLNGSDPVQFPNEHPLSAAQSMYWSWATKYRFVRIDGRANENGTIGNPDDLLIAYHPGADEFYKEIELVNPFSIEAGGSADFNIKLDVAKFFNGPGGTIDIPTEPQTHTAPSDYDLAVKFTENFVAAFSPM